MAEFKRLSLGEMRQTTRGCEKQDRYKKFFHILSVIIMEYKDSENRA